MTINGDEGEPGTFKDRFWLESEPHKMLEGAQIAALLVGCSKIYLYMRDEYPAVLEILKSEIEKLQKTNFWLIPIEIRRGAMTRDQAISLVNLYDNNYPENFLDLYLDYYEMTEDDFNKVIDKWVNKDLFDKVNGRWQPTFTIK